MAMMFERITNADLAAFLRMAAEYFRERPTNGEDAAFWANEANAERCQIAADRIAGGAQARESQS
jgi:hypothetical protein